MADLYYIVELSGDVETWRSNSFKERRLAEHYGKIKEKANPGKKYHIELRQPVKATKY